jgi:hypothetical protein
MCAVGLAEYGGPDDLVLAELPDFSSLRGLVSCVRPRFLLVAEGISR